MQLQLVKSRLEVKPLSSCRPRTDAHILSPSLPCTFALESYAQLLPRITPRFTAFRLADLVFLHASLSFLGVFIFSDCKVVAKVATSRCPWQLAQL